MEKALGKRINGYSKLMKKKEIVESNHYVHPEGTHNIFWILCLIKQHLMSIEIF